MAYTEFTLESACQRFTLTLASAGLFPGLTPEPPPPWLVDALARGMPLALGSEKARSEFIVAPLLLAVRERTNQRIAVYSGHRLNVDASVGLDGECNFLLAASPALPVVRAPLVCIVEAKKNDVEGGLGQCAAQMVAAKTVNQRAGRADPVFGCVTTGEVWQFLRLSAQDLALDDRRYYLDNLPLVLGALLASVGGPV
jgi:hypothetical protein